MNIFLYYKMNEKHVNICTCARKTIENMCPRRYKQEILQHINIATYEHIRHPTTGPMEGRGLHFYSHVSQRKRENLKSFSLEETVSTTIFVTFRHMG